MKKMHLLGTDLEVSTIAMGCMNLGGSWDDSPFTDEVRQRAEKAVLTAVEQGITLFDHADVYCLGKSEKVFGEILRDHPGLRDEILLQTKCGIRPADDPKPGLPERYDCSFEHILASVEESLRRLQTETIDILLLHRPDPLVEPEEVALAFRELSELGKVRYFGVSNHSWAQVERLQSALDCWLVVNQLQLSLAHSDLIWNGLTFNEGVPATTGQTLDPGLERGVQIQAWAPLAQGRLLSSQPDSALAPAIDLIHRLAETHAVSPEAIPLAWLLRHPARIQPVVGSTSPTRIESCARAATVELSREEWFSLLTTARGQELP